MKVHYLIEKQSKTHLQSSPPHLRICQHLCPVLSWLLWLMTTLWSETLLHWALIPIQATFSRAVAQHFLPVSLIPASVCPCSFPEVSAPHSLLPPPCLPTIQPLHLLLSRSPGPPCANSPSPYLPCWWHLPLLIPHFLDALCLTGHPARPGVSPQLTHHFSFAVSCRSFWPNRLSCCSPSALGTDLWDFAPAVSSARTALHMFSCSIHSLLLASA